MRLLLLLAMTSMILGCMTNPKDITSDVAAIGRLKPGQVYRLTKEMIRFENVIHLGTGHVPQDDGTAKLLTLETLRANPTEFPDRSIIPPGDMFEIIAVKERNAITHSQLSVMAINQSTGEEMIIGGPFKSEGDAMHSFGLDPQYFTLISP